MAQAMVVYVATQDGLITLSDPGGKGRWRQVGHTLQGRQVAAIRVASAMHLEVLTTAGALSSTDGGKTWAPLATLPPELQPVSGAQRVVLAGPHETWLEAQPDAHGQSHLLRSEDAGASWQPATLTDGDPLEGTVTVMVPASYHRDQAWAGTNAGHLLHTSDRGRTWQTIERQLPGIMGLAPVRFL